MRFRGKVYRPPEGNSWFTNPDGMQQLIKANRIEPYEDGETLRYVLKATDGLASQLTNLWSDTSAPRDKVYVVQTNRKVIERCMLMSTNPGDLVLDPTCGGGTTATVAEEWGRRWITIDVSRVPLSLARQRLLTATYKYFKLQDEYRGPASGFKYEYKEDDKGRQIGGVIRSISRGTTSNDDIANEIVLVDHPETQNKITRVTGAFVFEATIPTPMSLEEEQASENGEKEEIGGDAQSVRRGKELEGGLEWRRGLRQGVRHPHEEKIQGEEGDPDGPDGHQPQLELAPAQTSAQEGPDPHPHGKQGQEQRDERPATLRDLRAVHGDEGQDRRPQKPEP